MQIKTKPFFKQKPKKGKHRLIQKQLQALLPANETTIESAFPLIKRIADLVWIRKKIVIEVQCSPISLEEVLKRNADYSKIGYDVVWILQDAQFNQKHLSPAEIFLRGTAAYYVHINEKDEIVVYDQQETIVKNQRLYKSSPVPLSLNGTFSKIKPVCISRKHKQRKKRTRKLHQIFFYFFLKKTCL